MRLFTVTIVDVVTWIVCDALLLWIVSTVIALNICDGCEPVRCNVTADTVPMMPDVRQNLTLKMLHENLTDFSYSLERQTKNGQFRFIKLNITTSMSGIDEALKKFQEESLRIVRTEPPAQPPSFKISNARSSFDNRWVLHLFYMPLLAVSATSAVVMSVLTCKFIIETMFRGC
ncbi:hypothetical protein J6590_088225 [Homalodisca vitripennis]|nr:hypothetical protein J6590_088225 [Homalodisca vitripennis]